MNGATLVLATRNAGKIREMRRILESRGLSVMGLSDFPAFPEPLEDGQTFAENALKKAVVTAETLGLPAVADDSGLCVAALGGAPGVLSARYGGEGLTDSQRAERLLAALEGTADRSAAFVCVIALAVPGGETLTWEGRVEGLITQAPDGSNGFGYDPVFFYPPKGTTFARMKGDEKNAVSHRGQALRRFADDLEKVGCLLSASVGKTPEP